MSELQAATHGTGNGWMYHDKPRYDDGDEVPAQYCCQHPGCGEVDQEHWIGGAKMRRCEDCGLPFCPSHIGFFDLCRECGLKCFLDGGM